MQIIINSETILRQLKQSDSLDIFNTINNQRHYLGKWLPFVEFTKELKDTEDFVNSVVNAPDENFEYVFTIQKEKKFIGLIGFKSTDKQNKKTEIGYWLSEKYQKQGIVTKSVEKLCEFAFNQFEINIIQIKCAIENHSSINIPKKLGFKFEGIERDGELLTGGKYTDLKVFSKLKTD